jgi:LacI family transcriptional regulator
MKDVAEKADVSVATVSRVINNEPSVSSSIRTAVENAIEELNYKAKSNDTDRKNHVCRIGLVIPDIANPYFSLLIKGISNIARIHGAEIILHNANSELEIEDYHFDHIRFQEIDGIIYIPFTESPNQHVMDLMEEGFPLVFLDREFELENICSVTSDNEEGAYQATTYLTNLGHREIVFISGTRHFSTSRTRLAGYKRGLKESGIQVDDSLIIYGDTSQESAYNEIQKYLDANKKPFTAIFASNDMMAYGAWKALEEHGKQIPENISIVGYDDIPFSSFIKLTTIAQPSYEIGRNAMLLLCDLIEKRREPPQRLVLRDSLIIRKSSRKI